jgi:hypothetical protein
MLSQLGYGRRVYSQGLPLAKDVEYEDELNDRILDRVAIAIWRYCQNVKVVRSTPTVVVSLLLLPSGLKRINAPGVMLILSLT